MTDIMKFIQEERIKQGISRKQLADEIMMNPTTVYLWENYKFVPKFEAVENMLDVLGYEIVLNKKDTYEWCTGCKEYDQEKHCCPRWSKQIRQTIEELKENYKMEVYCTFDKCLFNKPYDEDYGICTKDHITLDETVSERTCGCPDAKWDEPQTDEEYTYQDEQDYRDRWQTDCAWMKGE